MIYKQPHPPTDLCAVDGCASASEVILGRTVTGTEPAGLCWSHWVERCDAPDLDVEPRSVLMARQLSLGMW